ncbi:MAG TPA: ABC transporter ATP-binding protein [Ktedonobacterales bacterium]|nr:ABC transporter ATP-binding protein [Ktedonobacterales bacterium]
MTVALAKRFSSSTASRLAAWKATWRIFVRIVRLLRPHWAESVGTNVCLLFGTGLALIVPWLLAWVVDTGVRHGHTSDLLLAAGAVLLLSAVRGLAAYGQGYLSQRVSQLVAYDLRNRLYDHMQTLSFSFHDDAETGQLMSRMTADIEAVRNSLPLGFLRVVIAVLTFGAVSIILAVLDWRLALVTLLCVPALIVLGINVAQRLRPLWAGVQNETGELSTVMQESLSGRRVVLSFAREDYEIAKFDAQNRELRNLNLAALRLSAWNQPLMLLTLNVVTVLTLWVGGAAVIGRQLSLGTLVAVTQYALLLGTPVRSFGFMITWLMRGVSGAGRIFEVLDTEPTIADKPDARALEHAQGHVRYEHVSFAYSTGPEVLHDISIDAPPGKVIALLGATGSGKSTVLSLLPRFYDVTGGRITVDGHDVRDVRYLSLRREIGFVLQDLFLFNATLRENSALGVTDASDEQIVAAAKVARLHDFIMALPDGYDTWVGERGVTLSGGQKQRVAIARTILRDPRILILDDSTSSVDMETEYLIQEALEVVMRGRTSFVVASRLRTVKRADEILVLERGRIVERGAHEALLRANGAYRRLYDAQLREQEEFEAQTLAVQAGANGYSANGHGNGHARNGSGGLAGSGVTATADREVAPESLRTGREESR